MKKTVIVASVNPVKIKVAEKAFAAVFPDEEFDFTGVKSESGVGDQPMGEETIAGARNRLAYVREKFPQADYWVSQEGGLFKADDRLFNRAWILVSNQDGRMGEASTASFYLPKEMSKYIEERMELGHAHDKLFGTTNAKHGGGTIGELTGGLIDRTEYYLHAAIIALSHIKHKDWNK